MVAVASAWRAACSLKMLREVRAYAYRALHAAVWTCTVPGRAPDRHQRKLVRRDALRHALRA